LTETAIGVAGVLLVVVSLKLLPPMLRRPPHLRANYRQRDVLGTAGVVLLIPLVAGASADLMKDDRRTAATMLITGVAMSALGYLDDVYGSRHAGGFTGHIRELLHGRVTTGLLKAGGGAIVGLIGAWAIGWHGVWIGVAGLTVALSANLVNLLDLRPGRAIKVWLPCAVALLVLGANGADRLIAALVGGVLAFGVYELRERVMLGDTGAGLLGGVIGVGAVAAFDRAGLLIVAVVLALLTAASEVVSFTRVIDSVPPLRWVDRLGRAP
jgi:UDP-N-acetylmuramyl pentapeptide phosphotransferase/UDP-N-acetylglucosamine-1-phosphate transferase